RCRDGWRQRSLGRLRVQPRESGGHEHRQPECDCAVAGAVSHLHCQPSHSPAALNRCSETCGIRTWPAKESTMTSKTQDAESKPLDDHEIDLVCGGFVLMEELVTINQIAIIMGMHVPAPQVVRKP